MLPAIAHPVLRRLLVAASLAAAIAAAGGAQAQQGDAALEAAFILNIARFTDWPPDTFAGKDDRLRICSWGINTLGPALDALAGQTVGGRTVMVRHATGFPPAMIGCNVVFVGDADPERLPETLQVVSGWGMLTIGDAPGFAAAGGVVNLYRENGVMKFEVNLAATHRAGLKISATLLQLARMVGDGP